MECVYKALKRYEKSFAKARLWKSNEERDPCVRRQAEGSNHVPYPFRFCANRFLKKEKAFWEEADPYYHRLTKHVRDALRTKKKKRR